MKLAQTIFLAISFAGIGTVHAQMCSGGIGGGMDATGNQCNTHGDVAVYTAEPATPRPNPPRVQVATQRPAVQDLPAKVALRARRTATKPKPIAPL
jgi:hypothetical protein